MQIFVKPANIIKDNKMLNTLTFTVNNYDTLNLLLERISERINIQSKYIYLLYAGKVLQEDKSISFYPIQNNSTIFANIRVNS
jgi:hypothetical protein